MNDYDDRVRHSYWNATYPNATIREQKIGRFLQRCEEECIPMDRITAVALSSTQMTELAARYFATSAEGSRMKALIHSMVSQRMALLLQDIQAALPSHHVAFRETLRHGLCIEVDGRRYAVDAMVRTRLPSSL